MTDNSESLYKTAFRLSLFTIFYNVAEGLVSVIFGYKDDSLTLFGFGVDSFIEVISGLGIAHMLLRIRQDPASNRDDFEKTALKVTGVSFYALVVGLLAASVHNLVTGQKPETTLIGVIVAVVSIVIMLVLIRAKRKVGKSLNSAAILADAECTRVCVYMSMVLLVASAVYEVTKVAYIDVMGSAALAYFSFKEGRECFEKAKNNTFCVCE